MNFTPIYSLRINEVFDYLESSPAGLNYSQVEERRSLYGDNLLTIEPPSTYLPKFIVHITHPMALLLWVSGLLALILREPALTAIIWLLVLINAGFSFWREFRAEQELAALKRLLPAYARLIREGSEVQIPASQVVPGDVLVLAEGDNIPADARVVEEYGLRINNAALTGEAIPARKTADASLRDGVSEVERTNLVFAGTSVVSGTGRAVVYATGMLTQFGRIAHLTQEVKEEPSPFQRELIRLTRTISYIAVFIGTIVFVVGAFDVGLGKFEAFLLALGIIVAAIPEGLPATITLSLAMAAQRLAQHGVLVKKLSVIEKLGNVSIICTDKSGTLTQNQMMVREVWVASQRFSVSGVGYEPVGAFTPNPAGKAIKQDLIALLEGGMLCNNSRLNPPTPENPQWTSLGDQTEVALRVVAAKAGIQAERVNSAFPRIHEIPFDARRKRMSTIHQARNTQIVFVKGAPREVVQLCNQILLDNTEQPLDETRRTEILAANDEYARNSLRVLALARRELPARTGGRSAEYVEKDLTFLGLLAMMDPPRPEVAEAVKICRQASIRMVMITGDYGLTAESLARRVGMLTTPNPLILTGAELDQMSDYDLKNILDQEIIFARMAPDHKLRLVAAYQERGEVVVVTGDGVNDAPALRKADVGVSMGIIGTDVAKESADVIITNDNFGNIVRSIEEGRAVYDNLRKFITYIFSSNIPEIMPFLLTAMFKIPLALTVAQILAIDLGTDLFPALALGMEKPQPDVMRRPPRRRDQRLVDNRLLLRAFLWLGMIETALCYSAFFLVYSGIFGNVEINLPFIDSVKRSFGELGLIKEQQYALAVTVFHAGVVMAQIGNAFACRTERKNEAHPGWFTNPQLLLGIMIEIAIILSLIYIPQLAQMFDHYPLPPQFWIFLASFAPVLYFLEWVRQSLARLKIFSINHSE